MTIHELPTPAVLVDRDRVVQHIRAMQAVCTAHGVELRPHIKTHKMVAVARQQLAAGAVGLTCAKLSEAEAMMPSGVKRIFIAHSLVDPQQAGRIAALAEGLEELRVACTSAAHLDALVRLARHVGRQLEVMMAVDTGLGREGVRTPAKALELAGRIAHAPELKLSGFYTHEGQLYGATPAEQPARITAVLDQLAAVRDAVDRSLPIWPGCSVTADAMAKTGRPQAVRPGAYVFGDLSLTRTTGVMQPGTEALHVLATVVDRPEPGLALIDAGSKTFSGDSTPAGWRGASADGRDLAVVRVNEEHGYVRGPQVDTLQVGERIRFVPAHVCTVVNLADEVVVTTGDEVVDRWTVDARGCVT